jgi:hypothetical protein
MGTTALTDDNYAPRIASPTTLATPPSADPGGSDDLMWQPSPAGRRKSKHTKAPNSQLANPSRPAAVQHGRTPLPQPRPPNQEARKEVAKHPTKSSHTPLPHSTETDQGRRKEPAKQPSGDSQFRGPGLLRAEVRGGVSAAEGGLSGDVAAWPSLEAAKSSSAIAEPHCLTKAVSGSAVGTRSHGKDVRSAPERSEWGDGGARPMQGCSEEANGCPERLTGARSSRSAPTDMGGISNVGGARMHASAAGQSELDPPLDPIQLSESTLTLTQ